MLALESCTSDGVVSRADTGLVSAIIGCSQTLKLAHVCSNSSHICAYGDERKDLQSVRTRCHLLLVYTTKNGSGTQRYDPCDVILLCLRAASQPDIPWLAVHQRVTVWCVFWALPKGALKHSNVGDSSLEAGLWLREPVAQKGGNL